METKSVYLNELAGIFRKIKRLEIPVKIYNHSGQWSEHFFGVLEVKEIHDKNYRVTVLILFDPESNDSTAIDVKSINLVELQTGMEVEGKSVTKLKVQK